MAQKFVKVELFSIFVLYLKQYEKNHCKKDFERFLGKTRRC